MSILEQLEKRENLSASENNTAIYILQHRQDVLSMSIQKLAKETYGSVSVIMRLCKKLGCTGYADFKRRLAAELQKTIDEKETYIDTNFPINAYDSFYEFSKKLYQLSKESLNDTYRKLSAADFEKATKIMTDAKRIAIFGLGDSYIQAELFRNKMMKINKHILFTNIPGEDGQLAGLLNKEDAAIVISYSGNTKAIMDIVTIVKNNLCKVISITSNPKSKLAKASDAVLLTTDKEDQSIKFSTFSSSLGIEFVLNNIYSYFFVKDYRNNSNRRITTENNYINTRYKENDE